VRDVIIGRVVGHVVATKKDQSHDSVKLLRVQPLTPEGEPNGDPLVVVDTLDAGEGDRVLVTLDGWSAGKVLGRSGATVDAAVVGVVDEIRCQV
jgi:ethanolamine utilization protein EutN